MKKCLVIYNPHSGKKNKSISKEIINEILIEYNYQPIIRVTEYSGHAKEIIENVTDVDLVISVGGDGTFNEIMTGNFLREKRLVVAHLPLGTANDIGKMYGFGKNIISNLKMLLEGEIKKTDICLINNQPFVYVAGFGKFVNISYETPRRLKRKYGYLAYLIEGLKELTGDTKLYNLEYEIGENKYQGKYSFLLISNANRIAGINNFYRNIKLDDDTFEVLLCTLKSKTDILKNLYRLFSKNMDITKIPGFSFYKTNNMVIHFQNKPKQSWCLDGEEYSTDMQTFEIKIERGVELLLPSKNISKLFIK